jgi:CheY-like chemotaxis protein
MFDKWAEKRDSKLANENKSNARRTDVAGFGRLFLTGCRICLSSDRSCERTTMNGKKILLVDDDPVILKSLSIKLNAKGYEVLTASDGSQAVSAARTLKPDLILLDLTFPPDVAHGGGAWDGFQIMQWLKRMDEAANIPIVVITGGDPAKYEERARQLGATAFFHKPIDHDGLFDVISTALGESVAAT